jgi:hypothetical protein
MFIGQISVGWTSEPDDVDVAPTVMNVASGMLFNKK